MKFALVNGNWGTAGTWGTVTNTPTSHVSTVLTLSAVARNTATFTAPNTTDACYGVGLILTTPGTCTVTVTLQENSINTAATVSRSFTQGTATTGGSVFWFEFPTPYTFTATTAGYYRFAITASAITNATIVAADSGGTLPAYYAVDGRTGVPGAESVCISEKTVTMNGTRSCGSSSSDTTALGGTLFRSVGLGVHIANGGILEFDTAASTQLTSMGHVYCSGTGIYRMGTVASPYPTAYTAKLIIDQNASTGSFGFYSMPTASFIWQGRSIANRQTRYVSGTGTVASPLVVAASTSAWSVNDQIIIAGSAYNESETRYIKTINGDGSLVLSTTVGGAEAALTNTHTTNHPVANVEYNVTITTGNSSYSLYGYTGPGTDALVDIDNVRIEYAGVAGVSGKQGIFLTNNAGAGLSTTYGSWDNIFFYIPRYCGAVIQNSQTTQTFSNLIVYGGTNVSGPTTGGSFAVLANTSNKTLNDCLSINMGIPGYFSSSAVNCTYNRMKLWNSNTGNSALTGGVMVGGSTNLTFNDCEIQGTRLNGIMLNGSTKVTFNDLHNGDYNTNTIDIACTSGATNLECHFESPTFGSATLVSNYTGQGTGSKISMQSVNGTTDDHRTYEDTGTTRSTGTGLADTNVNTASSLAWRIAPENNTIGMVKTFKVLARPNQYITVSGKLQKNAAFGTSACTVEILLPGETTAATSVTMPNDTAWNVFNLATNYTGTRNSYATVRITAITATASAYVYLDDLYNGTNPIVALDVWDRGEPSTIMFEQLGDSAAVWAVLTSTFTTSGTVGYFVTKLLKMATFINFIKKLK